MKKENNLSFKFISMCNKMNKTENISVVTSAKTATLAIQQGQQQEPRDSAHVTDCMYVCLYTFKKIYINVAATTHIRNLLKKKKLNNKKLRDDSGICDLISIDWKTGKNSGLARSNQRKRKQKLVVSHRRKVQI